MTFEIKVIEFRVFLNKPGANLLEAASVCKCLPSFFYVFGEHSSSGVIVNFVTVNVSLNELVIKTFIFIMVIGFLNFDINSKALIYSNESFIFIVFW